MSGYQNIDFDSLPGIGKDSWIKYSLNRSYNNPYPESEMRVHLRPKGPTEVVPMDVAANRVALEIYSQYKKIFLAMSGGIDSEYVAKVLHRLGIPFTPIIFEVEDLNELDRWWAYKWCRENNVTPRVIRVDGDTFIEGLVSINKQFCTRTAGGPYAMTRCAELARSEGGVLLTGAAFIEYFPDCNLNYLSTTDYKDSMLHDADGNINKFGYIFHEPDIINCMLLTDMPFNFLSWTPEIVLAYMSARDMTKTSEENKAEMFDCLPRPKLGISVPTYFFTYSPKAWPWVQLRADLGTTEVDFLGSSDDIINLLKTGI
jgi:hypothetical protein